MQTHVSVPAAVIAGLISFLSPCVLPLVPPYLCFMAGTTLEELQGGGATRSRRGALLASLLFVAGFSTVFVALGATASAFGALLRQYGEALSILAGLAIIAMGLHFTGLFRLNLLYRQARVEVQRPPGLWSAYAMGLAFAFGWTPCIGPILAAILAVAGSQATVGTGAALLLAYSAGLGLPFVLAAAAMGAFTAFLQGFKRHFATVERVAGVALVLTGIAFLSGGLQSLSFWLIETFPGLARLG